MKHLLPCSFALAVVFATPCSAQTPDRNNANSTAPAPRQDAPERTLPSHGGGAQPPINNTYQPSIYSDVAAPVRNTATVDDRPTRLVPGDGKGTAYIQDRGMREARYASLGNPARPPAYNSFVDAHPGTVEARFNPSFRRFFYYCTSQYSRGKCDSLHAPGAASCAAQEIPADRDQYYRDAVNPTNSPFNIIYSIHDARLQPDKTSRYSNSAQFYSFDGYVVYNTDTLVGIVTITGNMVAVEHMVVSKGSRSNSYALADNALKAIRVYKGVRTLDLVRLSDGDKHLHRVVHAGKLPLYDRSYNFLTAGNTAKRLLTAPTTTGEQNEIKSSGELTAAINAAYGLTLTPGQPRAELIAILNRLD